MKINHQRQSTRGKLPKRTLSILAKAATLLDALRKLDPRHPLVKSAPSRTRDDILMHIAARAALHALKHAHSKLGSNWADHIQTIDFNIAPTAHSMRRAPNAPPKPRVDPFGDQ